MCCERADYLYTFFSDLRRGDEVMPMQLREGARGVNCLGEVGKASKICMQISDSVCVGVAARFVRSLLRECEARPEGRSRGD